MMFRDRSAIPQIVLVVEDEFLLRMLAVNMVEDAGYTSIEAADTDEAFAILESRSDIALLFTDIQMPGSMDGLQLAHEVYKRWPPIKIILVSGQLRPLTRIFRSKAGFLESRLYPAKWSRKSKI